MRLFSWNVNGIRAVARKGFWTWLEGVRPDVLCLQEVRCTADQFDVARLQALGYHVVWHASARPGYSGVATLSLHEPEAVQVGMGEPRFDAEGRVLVTRHRGLTLINAYFPNGQRDLSRVPFKTEFYRAMLALAEARRAVGEHLVICGDWNTAHRPADLKNWRANQKASGFTPAERALLDEYAAKGWCDAFRRLNPDAQDHYTWWSNLFGVRERNVGWRIDYHWVCPGLWPRVRAARIHMDVLGSDHCPIELEVEAG